MPIGPSPILDGNMKKELASTFEAVKHAGRYIFNSIARMVDPRTIMEDLSGPDYRFKVIGQGEVAYVTIIPHRSLGRYPGSVAVSLTRMTPDREVEDIFLSLDGRGENLRHLARTPFIGTIWETTDRSWQTLVPYREQIASLRGLPTNPKNVLLKALST